MLNVSKKINFLNDFNKCKGIIDIVKYHSPSII